MTMLYRPYACGQRDLCMNLRSDNGISRGRATNYNTLAVYIFLPSPQVPRHTTQSNLKPAALLQSFLMKIWTNLDRTLLSSPSLVSLGLMRAGLTRSKIPTQLQVIRSISTGIRWTGLLTSSIRILTQHILFILIWHRFRISKDRNPPILRSQLTRSQRLPLTKGDGCKRHTKARLRS